METDAQIESANRYAEYYDIQTALLDDNLPSVEGGPGTRTRTDFVISTNDGNN